MLEQGIYINYETKTIEISIKCKCKATLIAKQPLKDDKYMLQCHKCMKQHEIRV